MPSKKTDLASGLNTRLTHAGVQPQENQGFVNPQVVHASTVLFPDTATLLSGRQKYVYGRRGTPTTEALENAVLELEDAARVKITPSGLNAITTALLSCLSTGDHLLIVDTAYQPSRHFSDSVLARMGIEVEYYDPGIGSAIAGLFKANTKAILTEAPGSLTFEMQDISEIVKIAHAHDALVLMDNTWATPLFYQPIAHGVDLSIQAGTKYIVGHSDVMIGTIAASERAADALHATHGALGLHVAPDDVYLALRGLRTMGVRLKQHMQSAMAIAGWLETHPLVARVRYPALESHPGHALWKRDFSGASGLFAFDFIDNITLEQSHAFVDALDLFGIGYSWGGFESLVLPVRLAGIRTASKLKTGGPSVRLHIGLEDAEDLKADLEKGFAAIAR